MGMHITWHGHSNVQIDCNGVNLLFDPFFDGNPCCVTSWKEIKKPDVVLVTHDHGDHRGQAVDICRETGAMLCCVVGTAQKLLDAGLPEAQLANGIGFNIGGTITLKGADITMTQALHSSESGVPTGYIVRLPNGPTIYHSGDTGVFSSMALFADLYAIDLAMLPIGGVFTMDARQAALACSLLRAKAVLPLHWGTFPVLAQSTEAFSTELKKAAPGCRMLRQAIGVSAPYDACECLP
jgi:L-ascorbate metabolism protein UlaG (beta-lactamase superfamily)